MRVVGREGHGKYCGAMTRWAHDPRGNLSQVTPLIIMHPIPDPNSLEEYLADVAINHTESTMQEEDVLALARQFLSWDPNESTRHELDALIKGADIPQLRSMFEKRIAFGTAGLRAAMGPGYSRMNDLIILQTSQGLVKYLSAQLGEETAQSRGIVVGYDHRRAGTLTSLRFARMTAAVFLSKG